jgi:multidrug transporter EmrE-like cation transporter
MPEFGSLFSKVWFLIACATCFNLVAVYFLGQPRGMRTPVSFVLVAVTIVATQWFLGLAIEIKQDVGPQIATLVTFVMIFAVLLDVQAGKTPTTWRWIGYLVLLAGIYLVNVLGDPSKNV